MHTFTIIDIAKYSHKYMHIAMACVYERERKKLRERKKKKRVDGTKLIAVLYISSCVQSAKLGFIFFFFFLSSQANAIQKGERE